MNGPVAITLPGGFWRDGVCHREGGVRPLTGSDEAFLLEEGQALLPAHRTTALLARCLTYLGPLQPVPVEAVRSLTAGNREALLLHLRRLTRGDRLPCVLLCPHLDCGEKMDLELQVRDLLLPPYPHLQPWHEALVREDGAAYRVRFRLPTGADQEEVAAWAQRDPQAAAQEVLRRCVEQVTREGESEETVEELPPAVVQQLPVLMAELDPQAELRLNLTCPACGQAFSALFDTAAYFFQELGGPMQHLYREVHLLAFYYHWSEAEIMGMTARKRQRYLELLAEALTEEGRR